MTDEQIEILEEFIKSVITAHGSEHVEDTLNLMHVREELKRVFKNEGMGTKAPVAVEDTH